MNNIQETVMNMMNNVGLNAEDFVLLTAAQNGNKDACARLYTNHTAEFERMHRYGPDGKHPKKFGFSQSKNGASYEEASGYCYICFYDCVQHYNMNSGVPFMAWVRKIFAKRGLDWVEERNPDGYLFEGDLISESGEKVKESGYSLPETFTEGRRVNAMDFENASADVFRARYGYNGLLDDEEILTKEGAEKVREYLCGQGEDKLVKFIESYILLANASNNPMQDVADLMKVRRQSSYNYLKATKARVTEHFGNHFYGRK